MKLTLEAGYYKTGTYMEGNAINVYVWKTFKRTAMVQFDFDERPRKVMIYEEPNEGWVLDDIENEIAFYIQDFVKIG